MRDCNIISSVGVVSESNSWVLFSVVAAAKAYPFVVKRRYPTLSSFTSEWILAHLTPTARVPKGSHVQLPVLHKYGGSGEGTMLEESNPLYIALFMLKGRR